MDEPHNPYAPPAAAVADVEAAPTDKNPHVELACKLMWVSLALPSFDNILLFIRTPSTAGRIGIVIGVVFGLAVGSLIVAWFIRKLRAGRNWMRWLITGLAVLSWLSIAVFWDFFRESYTDMLQDPLAALSLGLQTLVGLLTIALLNTPAAHAWFRAHSAAS